MIGLLLLVTQFSLANQDPAVTNIDSTVQETVTTSVDIEGLVFEFENHKHPRTLVEFETGSLTVSWDKLNSSDKFIAIKYKEEISSQWKTAVSEVVSGKIVIDTVAENMFFDYVLGTGNSKTNIEYTNQEAFFSSLAPSVFVTNNSKDKEEAATISWGIHLDDLDKIRIRYPNAHYAIKYNTSIGKKQNKEDATKSPWTKIENISINDVSYGIKELSGGEKYEYKLGLILDNNHSVWTSGKFKAERTWGIFKLLVLIGALGMFIFGMKIMSESLQQSAGSRLRGMLRRITSNRISGVLTGFGITSIVQSSSVTTVMTVSFVNAGLMSLRQSAGVMMGANIGTTITGWLILVFGFKVSLSSYALIFIAIGAPLLFFKTKAKNWAGAIIGFALLFMGLGELKGAVPDLDPSSALVQFFVDFKDAWYGPVMFVMLGAMVTVVIQSSSAAMALTMTLVFGGVLPFEVAAAMILGENIGTTITAELASMIGNVHAKRSARIHSLFNLVGVAWALIFYTWILQAIGYFIEGDPFTDAAAATVGLALFHTVFNLINVVLLLPFVPQLVSIAERTVKSRGGADEEFHLEFIGTGLVNTPELALVEVNKELSKFGSVTSKMSGFTQKLLKEKNRKEKTNLYARIKKYEDITDRLEIEIANFLNKVSEGGMTEATSKKVRAMNSIANDLERIGDIFYQMSKTIERKETEKIWFSPEQRESLQGMFAIVDKAFVIMNENLSIESEGVSLTKAKEQEGRINAKRDEMRQEYLKSMEATDFNIRSGMIYNDLFSSCEKIGDHIINVSEALAGEI